MLPLNTELQASSAKDTIFDQRGLQAIRRMGPEQSPEALREVAKKFEAMFVQEMLKTMRASSELFAEGNYFSSDTERFHRDMYDQQLSLDLTSGRGLGLADYFYQNMQQRYGQHLQGEEHGQALAYTGDGSLQQAMASDGQLAAPVSYRPEPAAINELLRKPGRHSAAAIADSEQTQQAREENALLNDYYLGISAAAAKNASGQAYGASGQVHSAGGKQAVSQTQENFVAMLRPHAEQAARALNISPDVLIAQAALETGWGKHVIHTRGGDNSFNLFNIKSSGQWQGDSVAVSTLEYKGSAAYYERAGFRKYNSYSESFADYVRLIKTNTRYQPALAAQDAPAYADALQRAGYATDPLYANKIKRLLNSEPINRLASGAAATLGQISGNLGKQAIAPLQQYLAE